MIQVHIESDADEMAHGILTQAKVTVEEIAGVVGELGDIAMWKTKNIAPFRTGEYRNSIRSEFIDMGLQCQYEYGTDLDRGYALELGYVGTDSKGRTVVRKPYPHFSITAAEVEYMLWNELPEVLYL